jgi:exodeoxyribonuclease VII large subunit
MTDLFSSQKQPHPDTASHETIFTVAEYISLVNTAIKPLKATIQGEIGKIKYYPKAVYFSLFDKDRSVINCMIWISRLNSLGVELQDGLEVKVQGYPDVWSGSGMLSFKADALIPIGEGALKLAFERLKTELEQEGYFRQERKRAFPAFVSCIGLITSSKGVVIQDFKTGLGDHGLKVSFYDVRVEGINAIENIVTAIQWFNEHATDTQVLVIARGGGSLERLQPFNTKEIAKAIFGSRIPVMTAIGHETDVTIADLVADVRASVPMDAGRRLALPWVHATEQVAAIEYTIVTAFRSACRQLTHRLNALGGNALNAYANRLAHNRNQIDFYSANLTRSFRDMLTRIKRIEEDFKRNYGRFTFHLSHSMRTVEGIQTHLNREANRYIDRATETLTTIDAQFSNNSVRLQRHMKWIHEDLTMHESRLHRDSKRWYLGMAKRITACEALLRACDPRLKLKQGFSILTDKGGNIIKSSRSVNIGDKIRVQLFEGSLKTEVEEVN